jgi:hypothetical protein
MTEDLVPTPGGYRPKSLVHFVEPGNVLRVTGGRIQKLDLSGKVLADHGVIPPRPGNKPLMPGNVHLLPGPGLGQGWISYADWNNGTGTPISSFKTTFVVPPPPATQSGQLIYLFPGIQNSFGIYQPVLQWGASPAGGGNYWAVASWYVPYTGTVFHSQVVPVHPNDQLIGLLTLTSSSGSLFNYNCAFQGIANTSLPLQNIEELTWCAETLEAYQLTKCSDYPNTLYTAMKAIYIQTGSVNPAIVWTPVTLVADCGQHTIVSSNSSSSGEIDLYYNKA